MSSPPSTTFGASIIPTMSQSGSKPMPQISTLDSPEITPAASREDLRTPDYSDRHAPSSSPLSPLRTAHLEPISQQTTKNVSFNEKDLEAGPHTPLSPGDDDNPFTSQVNLQSNHECKMWPSKQTQMQERQANKKRERQKRCCGGCAPVIDRWQKFDKRQKLIIKIATALLIVGVIVAIAVGISVAVNGTVYVSNNQSQQIPQPS